MEPELLIHVCSFALYLNAVYFIVLFEPEGWLIKTKSHGR